MLMQNIWMEIRRVVGYVKVAHRFFFLALRMINTSYKEAVFTSLRVIQWPAFPYSSYSM